MRAAHPGTAVGWEERIFEVRAAEPGPTAAMRYRLAPWEEDHAIRRFEHYDAASERAPRDRAGATAAAAIRKRRLVDRFSRRSPGLLPGEVQKRMERDFGAPALAMTIASALPLFVVGFLGLFGTCSASPAARSTGRLAHSSASDRPVPLRRVRAAPRERDRRAGADGLAPRRRRVRGVAEARGESPAEKLEGAAPRRRTARRRSTTASQVLEPLLSLLPAAAQRELAGRFGFDAIRWGRITAGVLLVVGVPQRARRLVRSPAGRGGLGDFLGLVIGFCSRPSSRSFAASRGEPRSARRSSAVLATPLSHLRRC